MTRKRHFGGLAEQTYCAVAATGYWNEWEVRVELATTLSRMHVGRARAPQPRHRGKPVLKMALPRNWLSTVHARGLAVLHVGYPSWLGYQEEKAFCLWARTLPRREWPPAVDGAWKVRVVKSGPGLWGLIYPALLTHVISYGGRHWLDASPEAAMQQAEEGVNAELGFPAGPPF